MKTSLALVFAIALIVSVFALPNSFAQTRVLQSPSTVEQVSPTQMKRLRQRPMPTQIPREFMQRQFLINQIYRTEQEWRMHFEAAGSQPGQQCTYFEINGSGIPNSPPSLDFTNCPEPQKAEILANIAAYFQRGIETYGTMRDDITNALNARSLTGDFTYNNKRYIVNVTTSYPLTIKQVSISQIDSNQHVTNVIISEGTTQYNEIRGDEIRQRLGVQ